MWGQGNGLMDGINNKPAQHHFASGPASIAFQELFHQDRLLVVRTIVVFQGVENSVDGGKKDPMQALAPCTAALHQANGIINEDIKTPDCICKKYPLS